MAPDLLGSELPSRFGAKMVPKGGPLCTSVRSLGVIVGLFSMDLVLKHFFDGSKPRLGYPSAAICLVLWSTGLQNGTQSGAAWEPKSPLYYSVEDLLSSDLLIIF